MKPSVYNVTAPSYDGEGVVLYNTLSQACVLLDSHEAQLYEALACGGDANPQDDGKSTFVDALASMGFVSENPDEDVAYMRYKYQKHKYNSRVFELYICPTLDCNFSCIYCYEHKRKGKMTLEVADAIMRFVEEQFDAEPFQELKIVWYGGEPLLGFDIIEYLSERFITFTDDHGLEYRASIITNGVLATDEVQRRLAELKVWCVMATADGQGPIHDRTRPARNGKPTYDIIMKHIQGFIDKGFSIDFRCILEKNNVDSCIELAGKLVANENVNIHFNQMRDMTGFQQEHPGVVCTLSLEEHAQAVLDEFLRRNPSKEDFKKYLTPLPVACPAAIDRAYTIDELGNVYACTSVPGMDEYVLFSVMEPPEDRSLNLEKLAMYGNASPFKNDECRECRVFPLCQGGCTRCRMEGRLECAPFKHNIEDLLTEYSRFL